MAKVEGDGVEILLVATRILQRLDEISSMRRCDETREGGDY
jgi:hypothetical protein